MRPGSPRPRPASATARAATAGPPRAVPVLEFRALQRHILTASSHRTRMSNPIRLKSGPIAPCLPRATKEPPSGPGWVHEIKHDGFRILARRDATGVRLYTRNGYNFAGRYPKSSRPSVVCRCDHVSSTARQSSSMPTGCRCST